jgi:hypothetical protein
MGARVFHLLKVDPYSRFFPIHLSKRFSEEKRKMMDPSFLVHWVLYLGLFFHIPCKTAIYSIIIYVALAKFSFVIQHEINLLSERKSKRDKGERMRV